MTQPLVYLIILNYNGLSDTLECLESLERVKYKNYRVIVVDNHSSDESVKVLQKIVMNKNDKVQLIVSEFNRGYSAGNNLGIKTALQNEADFILILNNDTILTEDIVSQLVDTCINNKDIDIIGPKVVGQNGGIDWTCARGPIGMMEKIFVYSFIRTKLLKNNRVFQRHTFDFFNQITNLAKVYTISGCCMLFKRHVFEKMGLLDEIPFLYEEEFIIAERCQEYGFKIFVSPDSVILHKGAQSTQKMKVFSRIEACKSEAYFCRIYLNFNRFKLLVLKAVRIMEYIYNCLIDGDHRRELRKFIRDYILIQ